MPTPGVGHTLGMPASFSTAIALAHPTLCPNPRAMRRARKREEHSLDEALACGILATVAVPRTALKDGRLAAEEVTPHWPRSFRASATAAAAAASITDPALAGRIAAWLLRQGSGHDGKVPASLLLPPALKLDAALLQAVTAALHEAGRAPQLLELRFTESALVGGPTETLLCLSALRDLEVGIAINDWGRSIGSVAMLRSLPLTAVRLDPSLTHDVLGTAEDRDVARSVVRIAQALDLMVVAQAIDGVRQRDALLDLGVQQGICRYG